MVKDETGWDGKEFNDLWRHRLIRRLIDVEVTNLIVTTSTNIHASGATCSKDFRTLDTNVVAFDMEMEKNNRELKKFLYSKMYQHYRVLRMQTKAERVLIRMFKTYLREPRQLPQPVQSQIREHGLHRAVCDYIAGMTDRYALDEYSRLFDISKSP